MTDILIRIYEMRQSLKIIEQCLNNIPSGLLKVDDRKLTPPTRTDIKNLWNL